MPQANPIPDIDEEEKKTEIKEEKKEDHNEIFRKECQLLAPITDRLGRFTTDISSYFAAKAINKEDSSGDIIFIPRVPERTEGDTHTLTGIMPNQSQINTLSRLSSTDFERNLPNVILTRINRRLQEEPMSEPERPSSSNAREEAKKDSENNS